MQQGAYDSAEVAERVRAELSLVEVIARQLRRSIGDIVDYDDMLGAGREGLLDAARRYESGRGIPFRAYATFRVKGAILDGVRTLARLPRRAHERLAALDAAMATSEGELGAAFAQTNEGLLAGDAEARMAEYLANMATAAAIGFSAQDEGTWPAESVPETTNPEEQLAKAELLDLIRRTIGELAPDEAGVIHAYYFEDKSMSEVAEQANLSKSWVCRLHGQAMGRLTKRIKSGV